MAQVEVASPKEVCDLCHGPCRDPEVLPCSHCYCREGIHQHALKAGILKPFPCPVCAEETILPTAFFVNFMKKRASEHTWVKGSEEVKKWSECIRHEKPFELYCFDCKTFICIDCRAIDHLEHDFQFTIVAARETKEKLTLKIQLLRDVKTNIIQASEVVHTMKWEVEDQGQSVADHIDSSYEEMHKIIEKSKQKLSKDAAFKVWQKLQLLSEQEKDLSAACEDIQSVIDQTEQFLQHSSRNSIVERECEFERLINTEQHKERDLGPVEIADLGVEVHCAEELKKLSDAKVKLVQLSIDPMQCSVRGEKMDYAEINKTSHLELLTRLSNGKLDRHRCAVEARLKSLSSGSATECHVDQVHGKKYIRYTPTVEGPHELTVTVNGRDIAGSPFAVSASILQGKPVQVISDLENPWDLAVDSAGNIIVIESKNLTIFDKNGKRLMKVDLSKYNIADPRGVAVDIDGCIYVTKKNRIVKLSPDFELLKKITTTDELITRRGVAVVGDEVMVCQHNNSAIMVYTKDLTYVRQFGSHGTGQGRFGSNSILDVSSDKNDNVYVSDIDKVCIHVFSNSGKFLYSFGHDNLKVPVGVIVIGQYVYVADYELQCVSVFTTTGKYVTSFGQKGRKEGDFDEPKGMCVDESGFLYVCDYENRRIQKF